MRCIRVCQRKPGDSVGNGHCESVNSRRGLFRVCAQFSRWEFGGGWFINPMMLFKVEYVNQKYYGFPTTDIRRGGQFKGFMVESTLSF